MSHTQIFKNIHGNYDTEGQNRVMPYIPSDFEAFLH